MTRTWIEPIYDRTYGDITSVQSDPDQLNPKGCWNVIDLNRIEHNTAYCVEWMLEQKIIRVAPEMIIREEGYWEATIVPTKSEIDRVINNVRLLVNLSSTNPAIANQLPTLYGSTQVNYVLANQIEFALDLMHNQPKLPLDYWNITIANGIIKSIVRDDGTTEIINASTALAAEDEIVTIRGVEYGDYSQYQVFMYWSGPSEDLALLVPNSSTQEVHFQMPYKNIGFTANFETHIPRTLTINSGYISVNGDSTAETGPSTKTYFAGDEIMIIADRAPSGKAFYEWTGTQEGLDNIVGVTSTEDPSTAILTMPDCNVTLSPHYINAGQHQVTVSGGTGGGWYDYNADVSISATVPSHYEFGYWSGNTSYLSDIYSSYQSFKMPDINISFTAHYNYVYSYNNVQVIDGYISVNGNNVTQASGLMQTSSYTLVPAPPDDSQGIYNWTIEGQGSMNYDSLGNCGNTFTVGDGNAIITAHYAPIRILTVTNTNNSGNTTTYSIVQGRKQRLITTSTIGSYRFNGWYENGTRISTSTTLDVTMSTTDRNIEARYDYYDTYTVTLINRNNSGQTTTTQVLSGNYWSSTTNEEVGDYLLVGWRKDGSQVSTSTSYGFYVSGNTTIEVIYREKETYHLTVNNGSGSGDYKERQAVTIIADAGDFSHWTYSNLYSITNSTSSTTTVRLGRGDGVVTANYNMRAITVITNSGTNTYNVIEGNSLSINSGSAPATYEFNHWEITSGDATLANAYSSSTAVYAHLQDSTITAIYTPIPTFTVTMVDGYVWNGSNWVTSATLLRNSTNAIQMKPAPTGYQFLQWEVYVNGVLQTDANDVYEPLAETTRLRNLLRDITIKATYFIPDPEVLYTLSIERKDGSIEQDNYPAGTNIQIRASYPDQGKEFYKWTGDTAYIAGGIYNEETYVRMPAQDISITETYVNEGFIPEFDLEMLGLYGECCYETESIDSETQEVVTTEHWVQRWSYQEGTEVRIRLKPIDNEYYFSSWDAKNHDNQADARSIITNLSLSQTTLTMPNYDVDVSPIIALKTTYELRLIDGYTADERTSAQYYEGARADVYFAKTDTENVHYTFLRWIGANGTDITKIELYDGGMFNVLTPGTKNNPQYIKMPGRATELQALYKTLYKLTLTDATIDATGETSGFYESGTTVAITADTKTGMRFQYWSGDTSGIGNLYDPTTTITVGNNPKNLIAVYSTDTDRNDIGYSTLSLQTTNTIDNNDITVISGEIEVGFILTDSIGHIYVITNVDTINDTSTIYRMTKIYRGGNIYG